ncbi:MAG: twin-arginine translocase subunit TatB [Desulfobulbus propionicus]|nr:MAG: twin-arginine translocase subunit TatB [Desulfobulbus propionicus]
MFGIGLPEMIVIFVVALIVVGPDKLPDLARSLAKGLMEMKKTVNQLKANLSDEEEVFTEVQKDLHKTAEELKKQVHDTQTKTWSQVELSPAPYADEEIEDAEEKLSKIPSDNLRPWEVDAQNAPTQPLGDENGQKDKESGAPQNEAGNIPQ